MIFGNSAWPALIMINLFSRSSEQNAKGKPFAFCERRGVNRFNISRLAACY